MAHTPTERGRGGVQGRRESLPAANQAVRRRMSGPLMLPPLWRRHSCQERPCDARRSSAANGLPLARLEVLYSRALASHDEQREGAGLAKPPKHLWRQPRTHIRIKQRFNSDTERYLCRNRTLEKLRPGLKKPRMSWPSSLKRFETQLKEPVVERITRPLEWRKRNEDRLQRLAALDRKYLCPPPSTVPSERVFSKVGILYDKWRSRLSGEKSDKLCFLHYNIRLLNWND
eukprot:superscaffoldBa00000503_g5258